MTAYPYIPNALPEIQQRMLREIGLDSIDQLYDTADKDQSGALDLSEVKETLKRLQKAEARLDELEAELERWRMQRRRSRRTPRRRR